MPEPMYVLPNGDLWRGVNPNREERPDNMRAETPSKIDTAMAQIISKARGSSGTPQLTCPWCGQQSIGEKPMREHLADYHKLAISPPSAEEAALAAAAINAANEALQAGFDKDA